MSKSLHHHAISAGRTRGSRPFTVSETLPSLPVSPKNTWQSGKVQTIVAVIVGIILLSGVIEGGFFLYTQVTKAKDPTQLGATEVRSLVGQVGKLIDLPSGETPTIATVTDTTKLQGQVFFSHAQNGDKVLIYTNAKKAYLYRPSTNKIIEVGPINIAPSTSPSPAISSVPSGVPSVTITPTRPISVTFTPAPTRSAPTPIPTTGQ